MQDDEYAIQWSWQRVAAIVVAGFSILVTLLRTWDAEAIFAQSVLLLFLLAVIFWPGMINDFYRRSWDGFSHSGGEFHPAFMVQLVAWLVPIFFATWPLLMMSWAPAD
ncbi:hypothetical protein [Blastopirellula marina]|uniref:Uncharacterized protein n=1 Tax=Blastopirellula marina TaxID=124 RepID=A0A2S8GJ40_9BACT|nr:hypothetical protein [Blastopirellula marina]PQO44436.1 hypothetical protein C5Y93_18650 [Blastopirellula marina]